MCAGIIRRHLQRLPVVHNGVVVTSAIGQHTRQIVVRLGIALVRCNRFSEKIDAGFAVSGLMREKTEITERAAMARIDCKDVAITGLGDAQPSGLMVVQGLPE